MRTPDLTEFWQQLDSPQWPPEYRLLIAVLQRALIDYTDQKASPHIRQWAEEFIFAPETEAWSCWWIFEMLCEEPQEVYDRFIELMKQPNPPRPQGVAFRVGWR